jgi:Helicase HerA, central domain
MSTPSSLTAKSSQSVQGAAVVQATSPLALQMIPSSHHHQGRHDEQIQLATTMRSLVLDQRHPIALEVSGTDQQRSLLIRARNADDLKHVETQLQARLFHASFVPLVGRDDPFHLLPGETVSVVELHAGQASYLPLQEFERMENGEDPILGILGALDALPSDLRAIAQLALVPAPPNWSHPYQRKALEHALEPERQHDRQKLASARGDTGAPSTFLLVLGALFLAGYFLFQRYPKMLPSWMPATVQMLLHGKWQLIWSGPHHLELEGIIGVLALLLALPLILRHLWSRLFQTPMYDMRNVAEKTSRLAYRVRLRLYVIGPGTIQSPKASRLQWLIAIGRTGWIGIHSIASLVFARQWRQAAEALLTPVVQIGKRLGRSRWLIGLCMGGMIGWFGLCRFVVLVRACQWQRAARIPFMLVVLLKKGSCLVGRSVSGALYNMLKQKSMCQWQNWRTARQEEVRRRQIIARLTAAYRQYHLANGNYFVPRRVRVRRARSWVNKGTWWKGVQHSRHMIDVETLGALWHVPADGALPELAHLAYRRSRSRLLPPGLQGAQQERRIGFSEHAGHRVPFGLPADCLQSHLLIGGKSGEGKSTFMKHLALRSIMLRSGLIVIDPHGDQAEQLLALVPPECLDDVVLIDLSDEYFACGLNPIDATMARGRDKAISDLIKILSHIWGTAWGSRMEIAFEYALRTLYEANKILCQQGKERQQYTLLDVMPILTEESFCHSLLEQIKDPFILRWWAIYYDPLSVQMQRDRIDPVLSKVAKFESTTARHIVGQSLCSVDFTACLEQKKIVLVKLAKGLIGEDVARILGATILGFLNIALEEQGKKEEAQRNHVPILIDEFQTLDGVDWGALAELRKYGATFCLATQSLEYLREKKILPVVLANVKQLAIFRMSAEDAWMLHRELDVDPEDIVNLESLTCYLKLVHQRQQQPTFSLKLSFPSEGEKEQAQLIRINCQQRYMRPIGDIDIEIFERLARQMSAVPSSEAKKKQKETKTQQKEDGHARQNGGSRGRKSQKKERTAQQETPRPKTDDHQVGEITNMNWKETVGSSEDSTGEEEQEEDLGDRAE